MKNQSTTNSDTNPYSSVLFTSSSVTNQVQQIIDSTLEELQEINAKKSKKNYGYSLSNYASLFLKKSTENPDIFNLNKIDDQKKQKTPFSSVLKIDECPTPSKHSVKLNLINPINPGQILTRPASTPPMRRELPVGPDPSRIIRVPPERYLLPPFLWGKKAKHVSTSSDYEDTQQPPPPPVHRRRGRPRKNPLPEDYYSNSHNSNIVRCQSAQLNLHGSNSTTFLKESVIKTSKKSKSNENSTAFDASPKEIVETANVKDEKQSDSPIDNVEENPSDINNSPQIHNSFSESSIKVEQSQKVKPKETPSSSDAENESESDIEQEESVQIPEERATKSPEIVFPDSNIDDICGTHKNNEYLVKFKGKAYKDVEWVPKETLLSDPSYSTTLQCFEQFGIRTQEPFFNPLFTTPERIIDFKDNLYLVKWTGLGYKESTWEVLDDLNISKINLKELTEKFEALKNKPFVDENISFEYHPINIYDQFSLDEQQNEVVDRLYKKFCSKSDTNLYGTIGSILRLEIAALISVIKNNNGINGPYMIVVSPTILKLASYEMSTYTLLSVLTIPDDDDEEFNCIKENCFTFSEGNPKFDVVVVSSATFQRFKTEFPELNYVVAAIDTSEMAELPHPNIHGVKSMIRITVKKRTGKEETMDSQDDSTFLHSEFTIFAPMLKSQRSLYLQTIQENVDIITTPPNKIDKSRLYEVVTKLCSLANSPACLNSQEVVFKMANPMMKKKRFEDSGKMRVLKELISYAQTQNKRLMVMCKDPVVLDTLQLYVTAYEIPYVHVGTLGLKRMKLDDFSPEAKVNKKIIVLAQFGKQAINWLPLMLDIIVVFDGVYNPMYYFSHAARKPRKRDCLVIRLLSEESHEAYLASCADHYEDLPMYEIFKVAAENFMRPARESVIKNSLYLRNARYDILFKSLSTSFQYIFDEDKSAKLSAQESKKNFDMDEYVDEKPKEQLPRKKSSKSISSSSSTANFLDKVNVPLVQASSKTPLLPSAVKPVKKETQELKQLAQPSSSSSQSAHLPKADEVGLKSSVEATSSVPNHPQTIVRKLEQNQESSDISGDEMEDSDDGSSKQTATNQVKKQKTVQIQDSLNVDNHDGNSSSLAGNPSMISAINSSANITNQFASVKNVKSEPNLINLQNKRKRIFKRKIRLDPGQPCPPKPEHGTITIHHHHHRISASSSSSSSVIQAATLSAPLTPPPSMISSSDKASMAVISSEQKMKNSDFFYKFAEIPNVSEYKENSEFSQVWTFDDFNLLLINLTNRPWGQWGIVQMLMNNRFSLKDIKETSYKLVKICLNVYNNQNDFLLLRQIVKDHKFLNDSLSLIDEFVSKNIVKQDLHYKLLKISCMLTVAIVMAASSNPPNDIYVNSPDTKTQPQKWWNQNDDRQLIYHVWQNGYSLFGCSPQLWSNKTSVPSNLLIIRFESLMRAIEKDVLSKSIIVFPMVVKEHRIVVYDRGQVQANSNSSIGSIVNDFGFTDISIMCKLSGQPFDNVVNIALTLTQNPQFSVISDFFEHLRYELLSPSFYYTEDYELMKAVDFHGRNHCMQSLFIQSIMQNSPNFDFNIIMNKVKTSFESRRDEPITHSNTSFNAIGNIKPVLPFSISAQIRINNLGVISNKSGFHNEDFIYPVDFESVTTFHSASEPASFDNYLCQIVDNGSENPTFKVTSLRNKTVFQDASPDGVWKQVADKVSYVNSRSMFESSQTPGHELFGLSFPTTLRLIQSLKGADQCMKYRIRAFKVPFEKIVQNNNNKINE